MEARIRHAVVDIVTAIMFGMLVGCVPCNERDTASVGDQTPIRVLLTWTNYCPDCSLPENAVYIFDGRVMGQGGEGFNAVLDAIKELPRNSEIVMFPNRELEYDGPSAPARLAYTAYPFGHHINAYHRLLKLCERKDLRLTQCHPYPKETK